MNRKFILKKIVLVTLLLNTLSCVYGQADSIIKIIDTIKPKNAITITAEVNYLRHYLWRSILFGSNDVSQPLLGIAYKGFYLNLNCNLNYIPKNLPEELYIKKVVYDEQDIEIGYTNSFKKLDYQVRFLAYYYFNQIGSPNTKEISISLSHPIYKNLSGFTEFVTDINAYKGAIYNNTGISYEGTKKKTDIEIKSSFGYGNANFSDAYFGVPKSGLLFWGNQIEVKHTFKSMYCKLLVEHNFYLQNAIKNETGVNNTSNFIFTLGKEFTIKLKN